MEVKYNNYNKNKDNKRNKCDYRTRWNKCERIGASIVFINISACLDIYILSYAFNSNGLMTFFINFKFFFVILWSCSIMCSPTADGTGRFQLTCSLKRVMMLRLVWPMYFCSQWSQLISYIPDFFSSSVRSFKLPNRCCVVWRHFWIYSLLWEQNVIWFVSFRPIDLLESSDSSSVCTRSVSRSFCLSGSLCNRSKPPCILCIWLRP